MRGVRRDPRHSSDNVRQVGTRLGHSGVGYRQITRKGREGEASSIKLRQTERFVRHLSQDVAAIYARHHSHYRKHQFSAPNLSIERVRKRWDQLPVRHRLIGLWNPSPDCCASQDTPSTLSSSLLIAGHLIGSPKGPRTIKKWISVNSAGIWRKVRKPSIGADSFFFLVWPLPCRNECHLQIKWMSVE